MSELNYTAFRERYLAMATPDLPGFGDNHARFTEETVMEKLFHVSDKLIDNAKKFNLTSILKPGEIIRKHLIDSLIPLGILLDLGIERSSILDVGTGAGFPLLPWACALHDEEVQLIGMDATAKKIAHILETRDATGLPNLDAISGRAEELAAPDNPAYDLRDSFDLVTARAVADLPILMEICSPFVADGGHFAALKGHAKDEIRASKKAAKLLGLTLVEAFEYQIPGGDGRTLVLYRKDDPTPLKYPRRYGDIVKKPL